VELQLHRLLNKSFRIARYSREDPDVLEFHDMVLVKPVFFIFLPFSCSWYM
jgi:hypothetical protein